MCGREQYRDGFAQMREGAHHHPDLRFDDPVGVVALVGQRPLVALDDRGQPHGQRFADAAGTGISDEEVGQAHLKRDVGGEFLDVHRHAMAHRAQFAQGFLVASAENGHLDFGPATIDGPRD